MQAKRSNAEFADLVDKTVAQRHVFERKKKRQSAEISIDIGTKKEPDEGEVLPQKRQFRQTQVIANTHGERSARVDQSLLRDVFGKK